MYSTALTMRELVWSLVVVAMLMLMSEVRISSADDTWAGDLTNNLNLEKKVDSQQDDVKIRLRREDRITPAGYDCNVPPVHGGDNEPAEVKIGFYINHIQFKEEENVEMTFYFRQGWKDKRLQFKGSRSKIQLPVEGGPCIWTPDSFFRNALEVRDHTLPSKNTMTRLADIGDVWHVRKLSTKTPCKSQNPDKFPMDSRSCSLIIESFSKTADVLYFAPMTNMLEVDSYLVLGNWKITGQDQGDCSQNYTTGTYPCLQMSLMFTRELKHYVHNVYLPTVLLVVLSWTPLLIGARHKLTAKLLPGLFAEIGLIFLGINEAYDGMPETASVTAMHVWMGFSHLLVFLSILVVIVLHKIVSCQGGSAEGNTGKIERKAAEMLESKACEKSWCLDMIAAVVFLSLYILFNIIYWSTYNRV